MTNSKRLYPTGTALFMSGGYNATARLPKVGYLRKGLLSTAVPSVLLLPAIALAILLLSAIVYHYWR